MNFLPTQKFKPKILLKYFPAFFFLAVLFFPARVAPQQPTVQALSPAAMTTSYKQVNALPETAHLVMHLSQASKRIASSAKKSLFHRTPDPKLCPLVEIIQKGLQELKKHPQNPVKKTVLLQSTDITKTIFAELIFKIVSSPAGQRHIHCTINFQGLTSKEPLESQTIITKALNFKGKSSWQHPFLYFGAGSTTIIGLGWLLRSREENTQHATDVIDSQKNPFKTPQTTLKGSAAPNASSETLDAASGSFSASGSAQPRRLSFSEEGLAAEGSSNNSPEELFDVLNKIFYAIAVTDLELYAADAIDLDDAFIATSIEFDTAPRDKKDTIIAAAKNLIRKLAALYKITVQENSIKPRTSNSGANALTESEMELLIEILSTAS